MKQATLSKSAFAVTAILVGLLVVGAPACAGSEESPAEAVATPDAAPATTVPPAATTPAPPEKKCPSSCTTDAECANACPALPGGVQCCDVTVGKCFGSKTATCPAPGPTGTEPPPAY